MVQLVTGELFVENLVAAMVLGMMTALWRFGEDGEKRFLYLAAVLAGTAIATKVGGLAFLAVVIPFAVVEVRRHWKSLGAKPAAACAVALLLLLLTALPTYAIAYGKTGNPVFPFMNQKFPSPLLDRAADISFDQYRKPLSWRLPFDLTFHTSQSYEGQDGSFGFQYLLLAPLAVVALLVARRRPAVSAAVVALGAAHRHHAIRTERALCLCGAASSIGAVRGAAGVAGGPPALAGARARLLRHRVHGFGRLLYSVLELLP